MTARPVEAREIFKMSPAVLGRAWYELFRRSQDLYPEVDYTFEHCRELAAMGIEVRRRAEERGELLLGHYYQRPEVQEVCDFVGDSLGLGLKAKEILEMPEDMLYETLGRKISKVRMSAVRFMGDTAKIILGNRMRVFMPRFAGCSLVASLYGIKVDFRKMSEETLSKRLLNERPSRDVIDQWRERNPDGIALSYMNSTPEAKAKSWAVFTSRNALKVLEYAMRENPGRRVLMLPDKYLTSVILGMAFRAGNQWINADLVDSFNGACHVHEQKISRTALDAAMDLHPDAELLVHPECGCAVECMARAASGELGRKSYFFSTQEMIWHAAKSGTANEFIVATESGMIFTLRKNVSEKRFYPVAENASCEFMKATTLENLLESMNVPDDERHEVILDEAVRKSAWQAIDRMLKIV